MYQVYERDGGGGAGGVEKEKAISEERVNSRQVETEAKIKMCEKEIINVKEKAT